MKLEYLFLVSFCLGALPAFGKVYFLDTQFSVSQKVIIPEHPKDVPVYPNYNTQDSIVEDSSVIYALESTPEVIENYFESDEITEIGDGWWSSNWFGDFFVYETGNWIYHEYHGWQFIDSISTSSFLYLHDDEYSDPQGSWLWQTGPSWYPYVYSASTNWIYYVIASSPRVWKYSTNSTTPIYYPSYWTNRGANCYRYAANVCQYNDPSGFGAWRAYPGKQGGYSIIPEPPWTVLDTHNRVVADGLTPTTKTGSIPSGKSKVFLCVDPGEDFHFYRLGDDGYWTHKPGGLPVSNTDNNGNLITDPEQAAQAISYLFVGYYLVDSIPVPGWSPETIK